MHVLGVAAVMLGIALWTSVPVILAWHGRLLTTVEAMLFAALPLVSLGLLLASG